MQKYIFLIFLMGFISLGFAQNAISGTIKNQNSEPISNVEISILDATIQTKSNENGQFEIKNLPIGKRTLIFKKDKFDIKTNSKRRCHKSFRCFSYQSGCQCYFNWSFYWQTCYSRIEWKPSFDIRTRYPTRKPTIW